MRLPSRLVVPAFLAGCIPLQIFAQLQPRPVKTCSPFTMPWNVDTVFRGMPYRGKRVLRCEETLADGSLIRGRKTFLEWRDAQGRFRSESLDPSFEDRDIYDVQVFDPIDHVSWSWSVGKDAPHQAVKTRYNPQFAQGPLKYRFGRYLYSRGPNFSDVRLPPTWVHGAYAVGDRHKQICAPGVMGNETGHPVAMVTEDWLSVDLGEIVESRHKNADGRRENEDLYVLSRRDPRVSVFKPPAEYEILTSPAGDSARSLDTLTKRIGPKKSRRSMIIVHPAQQ